MIHLLLLIMAVSHVCVAMPAWLALRRGTLPLPFSAAACSFLLYYDFGIAFELLGFRYNVPFFPSIFDVSSATTVLVIPLLAIAPWVLIAGARLAGPHRNVRSLEPALQRVRLRPSGRRLFYTLAIVVTLLPAVYGASRLAQGIELWQLRSAVGQELGPFIILLSLPMHVLGFFASTSDARTAFGRGFTLFMAAGAICATVVCGQRSLLLFPMILAVIAMARRISATKLLALGGGCLVMAAALLPALRGAFLDKSLAEDNLIAEIVHNDFSRAGVIATVAELSPPTGSMVLPKPMSGYIYSLLYFAPRELAPFKGHSTAMHFTGYMVNKRADWLNWGFGIGMVEELMLNAGTRYCLLGVFAYGLIIGLLWRLESTWPTVSLPIRLGPFFICGYHLPSLILNFGTMCVVCTQLTWLFVETDADAVTEDDHEPFEDLAFEDERIR